MRWAGRAVLYGRRSASVHDSVRPLCFVVFRERMLTPAPRDYDLVVRQEPKQARMCGVGGKGL